MKRLISIALALVMCLGMVSMLFVTSGAEEAEAPIKMVARNLSFRDSVAIKYAFQADSAERQLKLLVWTSPEDEYVLGTEDACITDYVIRDIKTSSGTLTGCHVFDYTALTAKQMTDVIYVRACYEDGGNVYYSACDNNMKYSILEYAYRMLGKIDGAATTNETLLNLLEKTLEYGAAAQLYTTSSVSAYKPDRLATADWVQVKLTAGSLEDGFSKGLYIPGTKATLTAPATNAEGVEFTYWKDSAGNAVATTASFELTVGSTNEEYTPVYGEPVPSPYSEGLAFYIDSRGEAYVSIGTCTDTDIRIPPTTPDGAKVVGADRRGFENQTKIKSVSFPATITFIDSDAFYGCTALTDVYYDGTEEQWNTTVRIYAGNTAIENATKHFTGVAIETFTVTFVDFDGTVLKTETVESGKSATAPADPTRTGYAFAGWDVAFDNITADLTVTATYTLNVTAPTVVVHDVVANVGDTTVDVVISLENNPGIASMKFAVNYGDELVLQSYTFNSAYGGFATLPEPFKSPQNVSFMHGTSNVADSDFVTLTFALADAVTEDTVLDISLVLDEKNIFDKNFNTVAFEVLAGKVFIR